ncbi:MAG: hypothetical protein K2J80_13995 [Oscillospiraceae bacterium]|nr:hypothetical protein [Oscillospiraceae bacterium]
MRTAEIGRKTKETDITVKLDLDGGEVNIKTGIGFLDHMLIALGVHGRFGLEVSAKAKREQLTAHANSIKGRKEIELCCQNA